ncbi:MAG: leucyl aminopeptidase family protein [Bacteroidales bacterium]
MQLKIKSGLDSSAEVTVYIKDEIQNLSFLANPITRFSNIKNKVQGGEIGEVYTSLGLVLLVKNPKCHEAKRNLGAQLVSYIKDHAISSCNVYTDSPVGELEDFLFGMYSSAYTFGKYKTDKTKAPFECDVYFSNVDIESILLHLRPILEGLFLTRDLINEPYNKLDVAKFCSEVVRLGEDCGFSVEVFGKERIESLKMGGLLGVNKGSVNPPAFMILKIDGDIDRDKAPIVLVGKGVMFDTGGLNIKTPWKYMYDMKSDMGGAATVVGTFVSLSKLKVSKNVIGLLPLTDNRPGGEAMTPGDILTMHSGKTVEVLNTDAEGRLILADALSFAKSYEPNCVIDLATLTGSAVMTFGHFASAIMSKNEVLIEEIKSASQRTGERVAELPLWDDYGDALNSEIADIKNLGEPEGGAISAGKFLEFFTDYPWMHIDIAGTAYLPKARGYRPEGGTGEMLRTLVEFIVSR